MSSLRVSGLIAMAIALAGLPALSQDLGVTTFDNSGAAEAQDDFLRGLLLLHSFEYPDAREAFARAREIDPGFAMAYWGEAMGYNHPIWQSQETEEGRRVLESLAPSLESRLSKAPTEREKAYLRAADALFYGSEDKKERDYAFAAAMAELHEEYPEDLDAAAFYSLAILGTSHGGRDFAKYMRAAAVAEGVFARNPRHPGAAHYLIHSYDDPIHAPLGLRAAYVYADIAPAASHAQHMPSHIFVAMGMWDRVVASNEDASASADARMERKGLGPGARSYHALQWLAYGYLQQGRAENAMQILHEIQAAVKQTNGGRGPRSHLAMTRAAYVVETEDWKGEAARMDVNVEGLGAQARATDAFVLGLSAYKRGEEELARSSLAQILELSEREPERPVVAILRDELKALLLLDEGREEDAVAMLTKAAEKERAMPFEFGPPSPVKPSDELLGEVLLSSGRAEEAQEAFSRALERAPKRVRSLDGLARAAALAGDSVSAARAQATLREISYASAAAAEIE